MRFVKHGTADIEISVDDSVTTAKIVNAIENGNYEQREVLFAGRLAKQTDRILELGAGLGFVSATICSNVTPQHYAAVEADERLIPHIHRTHERNGISGVHVIQGAFVSDPEIIAKGDVDFGITGSAFWGSGIDKAGKEGTNTVRVKTYDVSEYIRKHRISILIADIEGGELDLLRNIDLAPVKRVIMEIHPKVFGLVGVREVFRLMGEYGFVYDAPNSAGAVVTFVRIE